MEGKRSEMFYVFGESIRSCALGTHAGYYHQHFKWHNDMNLPYASSRESTVNLPLEIQSSAAGPSSRKALWATRKFCTTLEILIVCGWYFQGRCCLVQVDHDNDNLLLPQDCMCRTG